MVVRLLGRIQALDDGSEIDLGPTGPRSLFAVLAMRANTQVTLDELVSALWGETAPRTAEGAVYTYVSALRKALEPGRGRRDEPQVLISSRGAYSLLLPSGAVDVHKFETAAAEGRRRWANGDCAGALARFDAASSDWGGLPLSGATGPFADAERSRLELLRLDVVELRCAALIETGAAGDAVRTLSVLTGENPLHERLHELQMLALYRTGRQAEALQVYRQVHERLVDELGVDPGPGLRRMHQRVLAGENVEPQAPTHRPAVTPRVVPAQLPHGVSAFTGREAELRRLGELCVGGDGVGGSVVISAIDGAAGVGKTALAIHVAHQVADSFPDGQLFVDLRGFDPRCSPVAPDEALAQLLRGLGTDAEAQRADMPTLAALYRSLLSGRRVLVVLDNAVSTEQVRPLLPGSKGCLALVTSRNRLAGLVARDGATRVTLDLLRPEESLELLRRVLGADQVDSDVELARELTEHCGHLPLALRIAAERILGGDHELAGMVGELRAERRRLDTLSTPDDESSIVRAVFSWSYHGLKPPEARAFRLVGLHPAAEIGVHDAAALLGTDTPDARRQLAGLVRRHLLEQVTRDRFRFHDLLRIYAVECAARDEPGTAAAESIQRLLAWCLASTVAARETLAPGLGQIDVGPPDPDRPPMALRTFDEAIAWAGRELPGLADLLRMAADRGYDEYAAKLATALGALCHCTSRWAEWLRIIKIGQAAAQRIGDRLSQACLYNDAGVVYHFLGRHDDAVNCHLDAVGILTEFDDRCQQTITANLTVAYSMMGRHLDALPLLEDALTMARAQGNRFVEASVADSLGSVLSKLGRHAEAIEYGLLCVDLVREVGAEHMLGHGLTQVGDSCLQAGRVEDAARYLGEALELWRGLGDRWGEARCMHALARALHRAGRTDGVRQLLTDALEMMRETGYLAINEHEACEIRSLLAEVR